MAPGELLKALVAVVATLGELAATVAGPDGDVLLAVSTRSLHRALGTFIAHLQDTLQQPGVPSLHQHGATSLSQALAALRDNLGATWAHVAAAARAWQNLVATLDASWAQVVKEATELRHASGDTAEASTAATAQAGDLLEDVTHWGKAMDNLVTEARRLPVALTKDEVGSALAAHEAQMAAATNEVVAATKATEEAMVAVSQAGAAARRGRRAEAALEPLERLVAACDRARELPQELLRRLGDIEAALEETREASCDVPEALVAAVAEAELLCEASARLATRHLLGTLGDIRTLLSSPCDSPGGRVVAERCQRAIEDIPRLLRGQ